MNPSAAEEMPEEFRRSLAEQLRQEPEHAEPKVLAEEQPRLAEPAGNGWLFVGMLVVVAVGVLLLIIFASGGNADESLML
jgi:cytochrome c-type biogenesis protein CcmH/NrfG